MRRGIAATVCSLALVVGPSRGIAAAADPEPAPPRSERVRWSDERVLSTGAGPVDLAFNFARAIAADGAGRVHVAWYERRDGKECACYRRSPDAGKTWKDVVCLSDTSEPIPDAPLLPAVAASG